jgi:hypothetical protein
MPYLSILQRGVGGVRECHADNEVLWEKKIFRRSRNKRSMFLNIRTEGGKTSTHLLMDCYGSESKGLVRSNRLTTGQSHVTPDSTTLSAFDHQNVTADK